MRLAEHVVKHVLILTEHVAVTTVAFQVVQPTAKPAAQAQPVLAVPHQGAQLLRMVHVYRVTPGLAQAHVVVCVMTASCTTLRGVVTTVLAQVLGVPMPHVTTLVVLALKLVQAS